MFEDQEYIDVDAVIRMPKGERLADSKKTEGWSRGFTPKSTDKGPEHVEIRLKTDGEDAKSDTAPAQPQVIFIHDHVEPPFQKTREQEEFEVLLGLLIMLGIIKATEWAQPRWLRLWNQRLIPFCKVKRGQWQGLKARRKAGKQLTPDVSMTIAQAMPVDETNAVNIAFEAYQVKMTSTEARRHFAEALVAQRFANERMQLLDNARIENRGLPPELANAVQALTPTQVKNALDALLASKPTLLGDLRNILQMNCHEDQLQLGSDKMKAVLRFTDGQHL
ncbi:hypothetical protein [Kocuria rosea]|uniref:hypothetical protein n=1 Tax=Kocuria rosea TaxID=1275 RepID=UPI000F6CAC58|nr:hypothetical protein [Kocuria rosea]MEB2526719.1 hypothetical protein [Kocuria rosea]MEB2618708.1 hypothetical protein [Kocuria rosea]VEI49228.1 Uncharacterised protein [Kocuria rosea]